jgi:feruloyl esterase
MHTTDGRPILPASKLPLPAEGAIARCDARDGRTDALISEPTACTFDPSTVRCRSDDNERCLTDEQVTAVSKVYAGARNPRTRDQIFSGWVMGSERGWASYIVNPP